MFILESVLTDGIAQLSYLAGDTDNGSAAVIDPRTDPEVYLELARKHGLSITHIFETHIHADFVSGSRSLADLVGTAKVHLSAEDANYEFEAEKVKDGQPFDFGSFRLTARHTPGHTPEHLSYELCETNHADSPWAVFSGDSLFVGSAGRPDLLGDDAVEELAKQLYSTLYDYYLKLEDHVVVYPGHGAGSACGASIGDRLLSTIGYERRTNKFLQFPSYDEFRHFVVDEAPPAPWHYPKLKKVNAVGPEIMPRLPTIAALPPDELQKSAGEPGVKIIDTRSMLAFGGGHVPGSINIGDRPEMSAWVGQMFDLDQKLLLVLDNSRDVDEIQRWIIRTGHTNFVGYLAGGMKAYELAGLPLQKLPQMPVEELREQQANGSQLNVIDVRSPEEWEAGHIPGAKHHFIADMRDRISGLEKDGQYVTYCASGYRANLAASLMQSRGFKNVASVPGSWSAWSANGYPVEK